MCIYIYIYIERERERDMYLSLYMCVYIYIYTYSAPGPEALSSHSLDLRVPCTVLHVRTLRALAHNICTRRGAPML